MTLVFLGGLGDRFAEIALGVRRGFLRLDSEARAELALEHADIDGGVGGLLEGRAVARLAYDLRVRAAGVLRLGGSRGLDILELLLQAVAPDYLLRFVTPHLFRSQRNRRYQVAHLVVLGFPGLPVGEHDAVVGRIGGEHVEAIRFVESFVEFGHEIRQACAFGGGACRPRAAPGRASLLSALARRALRGDQHGLRFGTNGGQLRLVVGGIGAERKRHRRDLFRRVVVLSPHEFIGKFDEMGAVAFRHRRPLFLGQGRQQGAYCRWHGHARVGFLGRRLRRLRDHALQAAELVVEVAHVVDASDIREFRGARNAVLISHHLAVSPEQERLQRTIRRFAPDVFEGDLDFLEIMVRGDIGRAGVDDGRQSAARAIDAITEMLFGRRDRRDLVAHARLDVATASALGRLRCRLFVISAATRDGVIELLPGFLLAAVGLHCGLTRFERHTLAPGAVPGEQFPVCHDSARGCRAIGNDDAPLSQRLRRHAHGEAASTVGLANGDGIDAFLDQRVLLGGQRLAWLQPHPAIARAIGSTAKGEGGEGLARARQIGSQRRELRVQRRGHGRLQIASGLGGRGKAFGNRGCRRHVDLESVELRFGNPDEVTLEPRGVDAHVAGHEEHTLRHGRAEGLFGVRVRRRQHDQQHIRPRFLVQRLEVLSGEFQ